MKKNTWTDPIGHTIIKNFKWIFDLLNSNGYSIHLIQIPWLHPIEFSCVYLFS